MDMKIQQTQDTTQICSLSQEIRQIAHEQDAFGYVRCPVHLLCRAADALDSLDIQVNNYKKGMEAMEKAYGGKA